MARYAGFDCSTRSIAGVILNYDATLDSTIFFQSKKKSLDSRLEDLVRELQRIEHHLIFSTDVCLFTVENPIFLNNPRSSSGIAQVVGYVKGTAARHNVDFMGIDNRSWKKDILGSGKASKEEIMKFAKANWGSAISNQDIADASCVALWGLKRRNLTR